MAYTVRLTDGTTSYDLVYDASSQTTYKVRYGMQVGTPGPRAHWHTPDDYPRQLIETVDDVRQAVLTIAVRDADDSVDDVLNAIQDIRRLLRQAARHQIAGDADEVYLRLFRDGATGPSTEIPIIYGFVDDSASHYTTVSQANQEAYDVPVILFLEPYGRRASSYTLKNELGGSPGMLNFDSGLAWGLNAIGTPTQSQFTTDYLTGGSCQRIATDASTNEGFQTDDVTASTSTNAVGFVWINDRTGGGADTVRIELRDGASTVLDFATFDGDNPTGYDKSLVSPISGNTWYRYVVSGTNSAAADFDLAVRRGSASTATTFLVDNIYLQTGTLTAPPAGWMSNSAINNRNDPAAATPGRINYIDVWGLQGDAPALVDIEFDWSAITGTSKNLLIIGRVSDGSILAADHTIWIESDQFSENNASNATWTQPTGTSDDHRWTLTQDGTGSVGFGSIGYNPTGDAARQLLHHPKRVFGRCRTSDTAVTFTASLGNNLGFNSGKLNVNGANQWELIDFGLMNTRKKTPLVPPDTSNPQPSLSITVNDMPASGSDTADIDFILLLPTEEFLIAKPRNAATTSRSTHVRGSQEDLVVDTEGLRDTDILGTMWEIEPGNKATRTVFTLIQLSDYEHTLTDAADVTLTVTPRTRHLMGTT